MLLDKLHCYILCMYEYVITNPTIMCSYNALIEIWKSKQICSPSSSLEVAKCYINVFFFYSCVACIPNPVSVPGMSYPRSQEYFAEWMDLAQASLRGRGGQWGSQLCARPTVSSPLSPCLCLAASSRPFLSISRLPTIPPLILYIRDCDPHGAATFIFCVSRISLFPSCISTN